MKYAWLRDCINTNTRFIVIVALHVTHENVIVTHENVIVTCVAWIMTWSRERYTIVIHAWNITCFTWNNAWNITCFTTYMQMNEEFTFTLNCTTMHNNRRSQIVCVHSQKECHMNVTWMQNLLFKQMSHECMNVLSHECTCHCAYECHTCAHE